MTEIHIEDNTLMVIIKGMDKLWTLKNEINVPLANIVSAETDHTVGQEIVEQTHMRRDKMGETLENNLVTKNPEKAQRMGHFKDVDGTAFYDVHDPSKAIVIHLKDEEYVRLVLEVEDPQATLLLINSMISQSPTTLG